MKTQKTYTLLEAIKAVTENKNLKFVGTLYTQTPKQVMIYNSDSIHIYDNRRPDAVFFNYFNSEGVCMRTTDRYSNTLLIIDDKTIAAEYTLYEGGFTDFVCKTKCIFPHINAGFASVTRGNEAMLKTLVEGSILTDNFTGESIIVSKIEKRLRGTWSIDETDDSDLSFDEIDNCWYVNEYGPYEERVIHFEKFQPEKETLV